MQAKIEAKIEAKIQAIIKAKIRAKTQAKLEAKIKVKMLTGVDEKIIEESCIFSFTLLESRNAWPCDFFGYL